MQQTMIEATGVEPRPYQTRIINKVVSMFLGTHKNGAGEVEPAARSVMIESPTGSGKTVMGLMIAKTLQTMTSVRVGWVAMRRNLLHQAEAENRNKGINVEPIRFISMFEKNPPTDIDLLVLDEAHHDAASSMAHLHNVIYLSLLRHICTNGAVGYAKAFRSSLSIGRGADDVNYSVVRALEGFNNEEGYAALRQRFDAAAKSWASVYEAQGLYKHLVRLLANRHVGWDGAALVGDSGIRRLIQQTDSTSQQAEALDEIGSPLITAYHRMTGDSSRLYGLANLDALSIKRQRTLPVHCRTMDLLNFASEVATHHADEYGARSTQAWVGSLLSAEYDLENSADSFADFQDFFLDRKLDGETAMELQKVGG